MHNKAEIIYPTDPEIEWLAKELNLEMRQFLNTQERVAIEGKIPNQEVIDDGRYFVGIVEQINERINRCSK